MTHMRYTPSERRRKPIIGNLALLAALITVNAIRLAAILLYKALDR